MTEISAYVFGDDFVAEDTPRWPIPPGANDALTRFLCDRDEVTDGMRAYLVDRIGADEAHRLIKAALEQRLAFENAPAARRALGEVVIAPALEALGDDAWGYIGEPEPEDHSDSRGAGEWAFRIDVDDIAAFDHQAAPRLERAQTLLNDLIATDWEYCESCGGWRPAEDEPCLDGCPVYRECPWCAAELDVKGACTERDCPFVACPVCADGQRGFPAPDIEPWSRNCEHVILVESGEGPERFLVDAMNPPSSLLEPPSSAWFDAASETDLAPAGEALGVGSALASLELSEREWTQQILGAIAVSIAGARACTVLTTQLGLVTTWDAEPGAYWAEVDRVVCALRDRISETG